MFQEQLQKIFKITVSFLVSLIIVFLAIKLKQIYNKLNIIDSISTLVENEVKNESLTSSSSVYLRIQPQAERRDLLPRIETEYPLFNFEKTMFGKAKMFSIISFENTKL